MTDYSKIEREIDRMLHDHHEWQVEYETSEDSVYGQWSESMRLMLEVVKAADELDVKPIEDGETDNAPILNFLIALSALKEHSDPT